MRKHLGWSEVMQEMEVNFRNLQQAVVAVHPEMKIYERVVSWLAGRTEDYRLHRSQLIELDTFADTQAIQQFFDYNGWPNARLLDTTAQLASEQFATPIHPWLARTK